MKKKREKMSNQCFFYWRRFSSNKNILIGCHSEYSISLHNDMERNANEYSELFYHCIQVLNEYNDNVSEEIFLQEYFRTNKVLMNFFIRNKKKQNLLS